VNCSALPETLLESELFGHVRGAFTDARGNKIGLFREANGGTLLLDEIGDMPLGVQVKLLRALEERQVRPLGGSSELPFDARIIAATHRDLEGAVQDGRFREDLYYRLNVLQIELPPLRSRGGDILLLAQHFLVQSANQASKAVNGLSKSAAEKLMAYPWPGNIRELKNAIERAVALTRFDHITADDLPERIRAFQSNHVVVAGDDLTDLAPLEEVERRYILRVLQAAGGNKSLAAERLGISRRTLYRKLGEYGPE
jgi:two-component system response regulator HydG